MKAFRTAFHVTYEATVYGYTEEYSNDELLEELQRVDREWFFGSEEYLWNTAILRHFPRLERIVEKEGKYYAHRLIYGGGGDDTKKFYVRPMLVEFV